MFNEKFWLAIAFLAFTALLFKLVKSLVINALNQKTKDIADEIKKAKEARQKAEELLQKAQQYEEESKTYIEKLLSDANKEADLLAKKAKEEIDLEIAKTTQNSKDRIKMEEEIAIREMKQKIVSETIKNLNENLSKDISDSEQEKLFNGALENLKKMV